MKINILVLLLVFNFSFSQKDTVLIKSRLPILKVVYNKAIEGMFYNKHNHNEVHLLTFNQNYSTILNGTGSGVLDFDVSKDGTHMVSANQDGSVNIWQVKPKKLLLSIHPEMGVLQKIHFIDNKNFLLTGTKNKGSIKKINLEGLIVYQQKHTESLIKCITSYEDKIVMGAVNGEIIIVQEGIDEILFQQNIGVGVSTLLIEEKGKELYSGDIYGNLHYWEIGTGRYKKTKIHEKLITALHILSQQTMASSSWDNNIKIIDRTKHKIIKVLNGHKDYVFSLTLYGKCLFSASRDKTIRKWKVDEYVSDVN